MKLCGKLASENFLRILMLYHNPTNQFCTPEMPSCKVIISTNKGRKELQVVKEILGGSKI